jgi:NADP-dependent aldehyde dehydrogenase
VRAAAQEARGSLSRSTARRNGVPLRVELIMQLTAVDPRTGSVIRIQATAPAEVPHLTAAAAAAAVDPRNGLVARVADALAERVGRVMFDGLPTGVVVTWGMHHGGPYPATTASGETSVGLTAARRSMWPFCWRDAPEDVLPAPLRDANPDGIWRRVDGRFTRASTEAPMG